MKNLSFILIVLFALCSCKTKWKSPDGKTEEEIMSIDIPRTHWGITLGDTRSKVKKRLADYGSHIEKRTSQEAIELTYVLFNSLNNEIEDKKMYKDMVWDVLELYNKEYFTISIYWYLDKVAAIMLNPYDSETIKESVSEKYPLEGCGGYWKLSENSFSKYANDSTILIMKEETRHYKYRFESDFPKPSYEFIYVDRTLMEQRKQDRDAEKSKKDEMHRQDVEKKKSQY